MKTKLKKAMDIVSWVALGLFVLLVVLLVGVRLFGIEPHIVLSGSMEPEIMTGSLVYVKHLTPEEAQNLKAGDNVTFLVDKNGTKITHKIYEVVGPAYLKDQYGKPVLDANGEPTLARDELGNIMVMYTTYGVNNKNADSDTGYTLDGAIGEGNLASSNVVGTPVFSIPLLGYLAHFVQNPPGKYITIVICALLIAGSLFGDDAKKKTDAEKAAAMAAQAPLTTEQAPLAQSQEPAADVLAPEASLTEGQHPPPAQEETPATDAAQEEAPATPEVQEETPAADA